GGIPHLGARDSPLPSSHTVSGLSSPRVLSAGARGFAAVGHLRPTGLPAALLPVPGLRTPVLLARLRAGKRNGFTPLSRSRRRNAAVTSGSRSRTRWSMPRRNPLWESVRFRAIGFIHA